MDGDSGEVQALEGVLVHPQGEGLARNRQPKSSAQENHPKEEAGGFKPALRVCSWTRCSPYCAAHKSIVQYGA